MFILMGISINIYRGIKTGGNINDKKILPFNIIQDVTIHTGPILNKFKLANIQVTGIYSKLSIDYLPIEEAEKLKKKILKERSKYNIEY